MRPLLSGFQALMGSSASDQSSPAGSISKLVILSYVLDWIVILLMAALGRIFAIAHPNRHSFSLRDPNISYSFAAKETVTVEELILISFVAPLVLIALFSLLLIPGRAAAAGAPSSLVWRRKLWEWNAGWMGFGVAYACTYAATEGMKVLFGKPRPDMLSRCDPDLANIAKHVVSGLGQRLEGAPVMVSWTICRNMSRALQRDGFVSFPSGHSSCSFAGLVYLTLWVCSKLFVAFPNISPTLFTRHIRVSSFHHHPDDEEPNHTQSSSDEIPLREQGAAPPTYLLLIAAVPICTAMFIASSRWVDNRHFGFDIIFGALLGTLFAWIGFSLYHLPLASGAGWAWGPRSKRFAFFAGVGYPTYGCAMDKHEHEHARPSLPSDTA
ncbi:PAP2 domain-containing protein [Nannizzia gypsea CBS 118893]|uniref:PAP2 domain-containing protein n=1 Tax=Arthroderma gypseum (strain ATCC MYA-4604 / CBS 118893) TaxID=535722 RepID=E4V0W8_ARTGP|nr:PAP2 domain-containing protein [Nannizzia gypsea CBS 118893]EFR03683.1 PAP2 domain-containing protein [Nannizzia gypsea CBS 118893]